MLSEEKVYTFSEFHKLSDQEKANYMQISLDQFNENMRSVIDDVSKYQHIRFIINAYQTNKVRAIAYLKHVSQRCCCTLKKDDGEVFQYLLDHEIKDRYRVEMLFKNKKDIQEIEELKTVYDNWMNETDEERKERLLKMPAENYETVREDPFLKSLLEYEGNREILDRYKSSSLENKSYFDIIKQTTEISQKKKQQLNIKLFEEYDKKYIEKIKQTIQTTAEKGDSCCTFYLDTYVDTDEYVKHLKTVFENFRIWKSHASSVNTIFISWN